MTRGPSMLDFGGGTAGIAYQNQDLSALRYAHLDFSTSSTSALRIEMDGTILIPGNIRTTFEETVVHATSTARTLTLTNTGGTPLDITGLTLTGSNAAQFTFTGVPATLADGASTTVTLAYTPDSTTTNTHSATLVITSTDAVHPSVSIALTGTPRAMDLLETWRFTHFGTVLSEGVAADAANPDNDGFDNFFEFSTGTDPNSPSLYTPTFELVGGNMEFTYTRSKTAVEHGVSFNVPWSETLISTDEFWDWNYDDTVQTVISETATTETVKAVVPMGTAGRRFLRLEPW